MGYLQTPYLLLDRGKLERNLDRMQKAADARSVRLRPHLKTAKSEKIAAMALERGAQGITVSTLLEAEYFADHGITDITYAVGMTADKLDRVLALEQCGIDLKIITDNKIVATAIAEHGRAHGCCHKTLIELDCGDHRGGILPDARELPEIAEILAAQGEGGFSGLLTHAGHSYGENNEAGISRIAAEEADCARAALKALSRAGIRASIVSIGSTPTALSDADLTGITEIRAGVYVFFDVDQMSRGVCGPDDLALSVVASVIGHNRAAGKILLDAGGLALSKDRSADSFMPEAGYGLICEFGTGRLLDGLSVTGVSQEHGHVEIRDETDFDRMPIGGKVRILPIHACMTAAAYGCYHLMGDPGGEVWERVNGW